MPVIIDRAGRNFNADETDGVSGRDRVRELDLRGAGIVAVTWATGFRSDFRWIDFPIFDERGEPAHRRGITTIPGPSFLGLQWLYKRKSSFFYGLEEDATHLAEHIAART